MKAQICQPNSQLGSALHRLAGIGIIAGLVASVLPVPAAIAANDYERCTSDLLGTKIATEEAASACARAFAPRDLSRCVNQISSNTITAVDALAACRDVRRPVDMASCVVDLQRELTNVSAAVVLDSCRRSLLPSRYENCVSGINQAAKLPAETSLNVCIDASYFPRDLDPTFLPFGPTGTPSGATAPTATPSQPTGTVPSTPTPAPAGNP